MPVTSLVINNLYTYSLVCQCDGGVGIDKQRLLKFDNRRISNNL